ncbi:MAG: hypothetical protein NVS3B21_31600 [Acidimicrobiales bacterium]
MTTVDTGEPTASLSGHPLPREPESAPIWEEAMPARPVRARLGRLTLALIVLLVGAGAYYLGVVTEKRSLPATATNATTRAARTGAAAATGAPTGGPGGGRAGVTIGAVKLVDGANIYVTDQTGNVVKVATTADSQITVTNTGTAKDVKPGDTVLVTGPTADDGTVTATAVRDQGTGGAGFGGRGARGGAGGTAGSGTAGSGTAGSGTARGAGATPGG